MLSQLPDDPLAAECLQEASDVLGENALLLDSEKALQSTRNVQLALLIAGVAAARILTARASHPDYVAGFSIGAYAAAVVAGALPFSEALQLVELRGRLMQDAYPSGYGMTALIGLSVEEVEEQVRLASSVAPIFVANFNADNQTVVSGAFAALEAIERGIRERGIGVAKRVAISVPSHCSLLDQPAAALMKAFEGVQLKRPGIRYLSGTLARPIQDPVALREDLAFNMARPINWHATLQSAFERGVRLHIEMPPGNVLTGLAKRIFDPSSVVAFQGSRLDSLETLLRKEVGRQR
jgi:malonate decarboxylase epsilon subunit